MTTYYPTIKGMKLTQKSAFDPSSNSGDYIFNELMSKPWTEEQYLYEHKGQGAEIASDLAENIWNTSIKRDLISDNPQDSFYSSHRAIVYDLGYDSIEETDHNH